jgi:protein TonB
MNKINIFEDQWCDVLFEERNQEYGAFVLRRQSGYRHLFAIIVVVSAFTLGVLAPSIIKKVMPKQAVKRVEVATLTDIEVKKEKKIDETKKIIEVKEIQEVKAAIKFVPPVILPDDQVDEQDTIRTVEELNQSNAMIYTMNQAGTTDDAEAVNPDVEQIIQDTSTVFYTYVEQMPEFPGGLEEMYAYLSKNTKYPEIARENGISGRVFVQFMVSSNGLISNVTVQRGVDQSLDREAVRVVKSMPPWKPGKQNGTPVRVQMSIPVNFKLQ